MIALQELTPSPELPKYLRGSIVPMITPAHKISGRVDIDTGSIPPLIEYLIAGQTTGILALGTTGESRSLTTDQKHRVIVHTIEVVRGRVPVLVGVNERTFVQTMNLARYAEKKEQTH